MRYHIIVASGAIAQHCVVVHISDRTPRHHTMAGITLIGTADVPGVFTGSNTAIVTGGARS